MRLRISNWAEYQHYKDRNPPWIKLHFALMSSKVWVTLDDASRVLAIASMLIASRGDGEFDADPDYFKRVAYLNKKPDWGPLILKGFCEIVEGALANASTMLADASTKQANARPEERREEERQSRDRTETETETETDGASPPRTPDAEGESYRVVFDSWNERVKALGDNGRILRAAVLTDKRREKLKTRWSEKFFRENWSRALDRVFSERYCHGVNATQWVASFDWFIHSADRVVKQIERAESKGIMALPGQHVGNLEEVTF